MSRNEVYRDSWRVNNIISRVNGGILGVKWLFLRVNQNIPRVNHKKSKKSAEINPRTFIYLKTLKYLASGWANTIADTDASGSIMHPSVNSIPISSGCIKANSFF
jgi:hypothetical protein